MKGTIVEGDDDDGDNDDDDQSHSLSRSNLLQRAKENGQNKKKLTRFRLLRVCLDKAPSSSNDFLLLADAPPSPWDAELSPKDAEPAGLAWVPGLGVSYETLGELLSGTGAVARNRRSEACVSICSIAGGGRHVQRFEESTTE